MSDGLSKDEPAREPVSYTESPPATIGGIFRRLGPGLIVAGSIVGSGELIGTTKTGAEAGFWLLWLIFIGCVIKVFVQVEFGRFSIVNGGSTMEALDSVPGPRIAGHGNWIVWYWFLMWLASIGQLGGIVGGVGQALAISVPLTETGREFNEFVDHRTKLTVKEAELELLDKRDQTNGLKDEAKASQLNSEIAALKGWIDQKEQAWIAEIGEEKFDELGRKPPAPYDDRMWAAIIAVITSAILIAGRYGLIQNFSTFMVCGFTLITIVNLALLQSNSSWAVTLDDVVDGLRFRLPPHSGTALATALATFGIIGVGASEIIAYPYWCIEKGYARFTGPRDRSPEWATRAKGWMRVMRWDAWCSMVIYTFATIAFYLLGAAILGRTGLNPEKGEMIRTLAVMYEPVFTEWASVLFLVGAFAVLYSTYFVANAAHARVFSDSLGVLGAASRSEEAHRKRVVFLSGLFPLLCLMMYVFFPRPAQLVLISGLMQAVMLPMLAVAGVYFRYFRNDQRLVPGRTWDIFLWLSAVGMSVAGVWALISKFQ
jgi:Mn2+/Fe2+ NRAMP family transporter